MTSEKWQKLSKTEQILNIGAEFSRAKNWIQKNDEEYAISSLERAFELLDLTIDDKKWRRGLRELLRFREVLAEFYLEKKKNNEEFVKIFKTLLFFNKFSSQVKI
ncbi:MAG: hypothetical protein COZ91_03165 [Candidatus Nealsonbacteria bacterium CG_4_8_14_3_um_filter_39_7]|uniref:Uncharacterized protein n=1 Tax=Candidatus Nealsonbacteria bacterium CG23_combo_of_CG06-09_8_20_14_all_39_17 TaxID=1974722 RepID=A0A2G9YXG7_9BACT|nr:MAG: hypothetical protein COX37_00055 [Candidatus Nealsonbacteria bacterium CG23_combo_of_CG06-09_8_20_14_all_39_17]PIU43959.1 MAG: hypothetical protein COS96_01545 [Candidatus Nealsonbacteria bacterium CG07_land_8_20_14_0_80_39_13]PIW90939.1 MAG: hypothetical protein COZ91_03165 [Candidatus Nealsonbacteria bacterium CG_4_8_14_3_um_filter_39_7]